MGDMQEMCGCRRPDITIFEMCRSCGDPVNLEDLRQRAIDTYDKDGQPIEDPNLPRRHLLIGNPRNSLRVLHLDDDASPILSGTFERASITHLPSYEAVSYCWGGDDGDYTKPEFIIIGGRLFPITKNCAAVLRKIRKTGGKRVIWIDSLCINQNDVKERSVQVSQMGQIFSGAQKVHIYLGNNAENKTASDAFYVLSSMQNLHEFSMELRNRAESVKALFTQTYFSRMWIIQEVLLAKSAELHWGTATIPWQALSECHLEEFKKTGIDSCIPEWMRIQATTSNFRNSETLGELLFSAMGSTASNDRDKVYGIYGLLFDSEEEGLTVDYGLSVKQVFTNMAAHLIIKHSALRAVLRYANHDGPLIDGEQLPSWVPDFRSRCVPRHVSIDFDGYSNLKVHSSISSKGVVSNIGTDELYLRGHRLELSEARRNASDETSKVVRCDIGGQKIKWEIRAKFSAYFDPEKHIMFWVSNGLILHLKRSPTRKDTYTLLGEYTFKVAGNFPTLVVHDGRTSFADAMFGLELQDLAPLWKIYMDFKDLFARTRKRDRLFRLLDTRGVDMEEVNKAANDYRAFCQREDFNEHPRERFRAFGHRKGFNEHLREIYDHELKSTARRWRFGLREAQKPNGEGTFGRDGDHAAEMSVTRQQSDSQIKEMLDFEDFWEDPDTWERLRSLKTVLQHPESYNIQKINDLCGSWLQHYVKAETLISSFSRKTGLGMTLEIRSSGSVNLSRAGLQLALEIQVLKELKAWEKVTEKLSEALQWAEEFFPPEELPMFQSPCSVDENSGLIPLVSEERKAPIVNNHNEDGEVGDKPNGSRRELGFEGSALLSGNFAGMSVGDSDHQGESAEPEDVRSKGTKLEQSKAEGGPANGKTHSERIMPNSVIKSNFKAVRLRWNELKAGNEYRRPRRYVLEPWGGRWVGTIRLIPCLLTAKDQVNLEKLFQLEERCVKRGAWREENIEICQAETIALV